MILKCTLIIHAKIDINLNWGFAEQLKTERFTSDLSYIRTKGAYLRMKCSAH